MPNREELGAFPPPLAPPEIDAVLDGVFRCVCVVNPAGICRYVNAKFCALVGAARDELLGCPIQTVLESLPESAWNHIRHTPGSHETTLSRRNGTSASIRIEARQLFVGEECTGSVIFIDDLAEQKHVEEVLRKTEKVASAGRMAAAIAHEINNPLEAVVNLLYLLRSEAGSPEALRLLALVEAEIERVSRISRQMLAFYRESTRPARVDIRELLNMSVDVHAARNPRLQVHRRYRATVGVSGYASELQQVFHNLIGNAVDAGATDLWLHLHRATEPDQSRRSGVRITIADNGCGIDPSIRARIFDPFFTTKGDTGTGLGLWITRGIILRHEGSIRVRSATRAGHSGTCFNIFLPR